MTHIFLRGVSLRDLVKYDQTIDLYKIRKEFPCNKKCLYKSNTKNLTENISKSVFVKPDFNQSKHVRKKNLYVTCNNFKYKSTELDSVLCIWCRLRVNWSDSVTGVLASPHAIKINNTWSYPSKGYACCDSCHLAYLLTDYTYGRNERIQLLKNNYYIRTGKRLMPSPDWLLLKENGGGISRELFFDQDLKYINENSLIMHGARTIYRVEELR